MQELLIGLTLFGVVSTTLYFLIKLYFSTENENYRNLNNKCHSCMSLTIKEIEVSNKNNGIMKILMTVSKLGMFSFFVKSIVFIFFLTEYSV